MQLPLAMKECSMKSKLNKIKNYFYEKYRRDEERAFSCWGVNGVLYEFRVFPVLSIEPRNNTTRIKKYEISVINGDSRVEVIRSYCTTDADVPSVDEAFKFCYENFIQAQLKYNWWLKHDWWWWNP